jgi:hypothetical protein
MSGESATHTERERERERERFEGNCRKWKEFIGLGEGRVGEEGLE